jgi:hypothetical protein
MELLSFLLVTQNSFDYCNCVGCKRGDQKCDQSCSYERFASCYDLFHQ